jgi:hypothetical protein
MTAAVLATMVFTASIVAGPIAQPGSAATEQIDLAGFLTAGKLKAVSREVTRVAERADAVHVGEREGLGLVWIEGTDFAEGTIEVEIKGRDLLQRSFVGVAFHAKDDKTFEAVYLRPFNFRSTDPVRRQHAVQYISWPVYTWERLRKECPEEFENPVDQSIDPNGWVPLRIVVGGEKIQISWIEADGAYAKVHTRDGALYLHRGLLGSFDASLDARQFIRIHRSAIVNIDAVSELRQDAHGDYIAVLRDRTELRIGRRFRARLQTRLGEEL